MSNELSIKYKWQDQELTLTKSDVKDFISTSPNVTDKEIKNFMWLCEYRGLNPFIKEAYLIKYGSSPAQQVVSKDVMDRRVEADERFDGEEITHNYKRGMNLNDFWVRGKIYRKGCSHPAADVTVYYPEYVGKKKDGTITKMWMTKPFTMLQKVCKAQMKRESNPKDLAGMYLAEEFDQEISPTEKEIKNINVKPKVKETAKDEKIVDAEFVKDEEEEKPMQRTKGQDAYIKAILKGDILTKEEKKNLNDAYTKSDIHKAQADAIIKRFEVLKAEREPLIKDNGVTSDYVSLILAQKKKFFIAAPVIIGWAGIKKLEDLYDLPMPKLEEILEKAKKYKEIT